MGACLAGICGGDTAPTRSGGPRPSVANTRPSVMGGVIISNTAGTIPSAIYNIEKKEMGSGAFGVVKRASKKGNEAMIVAMKFIEKAKVQDVKAFQNEVEVNRMMDHPNIVRLHETFEDKRYVYLAMECCRGGEMFDLITEQGSFTEEDAAILTNQMLRSLFYMHSKNVAHRDLKPENFLLQERNKAIKDNALKVIDFGIAKVFTPGVPMKTRAGTLYYVAPEVMAKNGPGYNEKCDVWSAGVILYILLCGAPPFGGTDQEICKAARSGRISFPKEDFGNVGDEVKELIKKMVCLDVKRRLTAEQALQNPWVKQPTGKSNNATLGSQAFLGKIKDFGTVNRFKRTALQLIARRVDDKDIQKLKDTFLAMDEDGNGQLTVEEMMNGCDKTGIMSQEDARMIFEAIDADGSGSIDYSEFIAATLDKKSFLKKELCQEAFQLFDKDGSGQISLDELREMLHGVGGLVDGEEGETEIHQMFKTADTDGSGEIDFDEFYAMLSKN